MKRAVIFICAISMMMSVALLFSSCGYECDTCKDKQKIECTYCDGIKSYECDACDGKGKFDCLICSGTGKKTCIICGGRGTKSGLNPITGRFETSTCYSCNFGYTSCPVSSDCSSCTGGKMKCLVCDSEGNVPCPDCS